MKIKKVILSFVASVLVACTSIGVTTAYAEDGAINTTSFVDNEELTDICGYMCYQRDGNFFTMLDGEEYLVIDTRETLENSNSPLTTYASFSVPSGWGNSSFISLPDGQSYTDSVDISIGDYYSPIYMVTPKMTDFRFEIDTDHVLNHQYYIKFYYHFQSPLNSWHIEDATITFNLIPGYKIIVPGTMSGIIDGVGIRILDTSEGRDDFDYTITPL